jgi:DNA polymerase III alpha subunit
MTAIQTEFTTDELTRLTRHRRQLMQNLADLQQDFQAQQGAIRQQAEALADLNDHGAERSATESRQRLKGLGLRLSEAEQELRAFCAAHPSQAELEQQLAARQRQEEAAARQKYRAEFVAKHAEMLDLLIQVETRCGELEQMRKAAPAGTWRLPLQIEELCAPLRHWNSYRTVPNGSPIPLIRQAVSQI